MSSLRLAVMGSCMLAMASLQGCAGFRANQLAAVSPDQLTVPNVASKSKVFTTWRVEVAGDPITDNAKVAGAAAGKKLFEDTLMASGCCVLVDTAADADLLVDGVTFNEHHRENIVPAFISSVSLYTIPSWETSRIRMGVKAMKAGAPHTYELEDAVTTVQWLPMVLAFPFANPYTAAEKVEKNTFETLIFRMKADGLLTR